MHVRRIQVSDLIIGRRQNVTLAGEHSRETSSHILSRGRLCVQSCEGLFSMSLKFQDNII